MAATPVTPFQHIHRHGRDATLKRLYQSINSGFVRLVWWAHACSLPNEIDWVFRAVTALSYDGLFLGKVCVRIIWSTSLLFSSCRACWSTCCRLSMGLPTPTSMP